MPTLKYNKAELHKLLKNFHILTGMLFSLYDDECQSVAHYPAGDSRFCQKIRTSPKGLAQCRCSDLASFEASRKSGECVIYTCHAGLIEATAPIIADGTVIGYLMLGQISNAPSRRELHSQIQSALQKEGIADIDWEEAAADIPLHSDQQIQAAAQIMESCISYILYKNLITVQRLNFENRINEYILSHLTGDLSVDALCRHLNVSRRKLYEYSSQFLHCSIARYIRRMRIRQAQKLLSETSLTVSAISEQCGFTDYNYFCRIFKKEAGMSARDYRKAQSALGKCTSLRSQQRPVS